MKVLVKSLKNATEQNDYGNKPNENAGINLLNLKAPLIPGNLIILFISTHYLWWIRTLMRSLSKNITSLAKCSCVQCLPDRRRAKSFWMKDDWRKNLTINIRVCRLSKTWLACLSCLGSNVLLVILCFSTFWLTDSAKYNVDVLTWLFNCIFSTFY